MKNFIRNYLTFNKRERNGVFVLLAIILVLIIYLNVADRFIAAPAEDFSAFEKQLDSLRKQSVNDSADNETIETKTYASSEQPVKPVVSKAERFEFDPNHLPESDWKRLGFSDRQIRSIKNYENKGGSFRRKEDVQKMYCISEEMYRSLEPYIRIPSENKAVAATADVKTIISKPALVISVIELNTADSAQLTTLKGIGAFYAKTIIKYRDALGGFYSKEQLLEVWKFDAEKYAAIEKYVTVDPSKIRTRGINTLEAAQLKHPYLSWNMANAIVNYRKVHGRFKTIDEIRKTDLVDDETLRKIAPYLTID